MARKKRVVKTAGQRKWKGKKWLPIYVPKWLGENVIGETPVQEPENAVGRTVEVSLFELTGDPVRYYMTLLFKVNQANDSRADTVYWGHYCTRDFISRIVQKRTTRIDTNEVVEFKDGKMRIKTITIANGRIHYEVQKQVREKINEIIRDFAKDKKIEEFVKEMITGSLQKQILKEIRKITPIRVFEFHKTELESYN